MTSVAYQLALRFEIFENPDRSRVVDFGRNCLEQAKKIAGKAWSFSDDQLWKHYEHRRWLPLPLTNVIRAEEAEKLKDKVKGVARPPVAAHLHPFLSRKRKSPDISSAMWVPRENCLPAPSTI